MAITHLKPKNYSADSLAVIYSALKLVTDIEEERGINHPEITQNMEAIGDVFGEKTNGLSTVMDYMAHIEAQEINL